VRRYFELASVLAVAALLAWFVWAHTDAQKLLAAFTEIMWLWYAAAILALFGYQFFRTLRTRFLLDPSVGFFELFLTLCVQCVINAYFPGGLGELSTIYLLRRRHAVGLHLGTAAVVLFRIADLTIFLLLFVVFIALMARNIPSEIYLAMLSVAAILLISLAAIFFLRRMAGLYFSKWAEQTGILAWLARHGLIFVVALEQIHSSRNFARLLAVSAIMWFFLYLQWVFLLQAVGLTLSPLDVVWVYLLFLPLSFLPLRGVAAMGPRIATWFFALQLVGVDQPHAATAAFTVDILLQTLSLWAGAVPLLVSAGRILRPKRV
jgi:uncharacterized protein (TIRG00374 family)